MSHAHSHGGVTGVRAANTLEILSWLTREHLCMSRVDLANIHSLCANAQEGNTSLILAIKKYAEAKDDDSALQARQTTEALIAATASAGALDVQVDPRTCGASCTRSGGGADAGLRVCMSRDHTMIQKFVGTRVSQRSQRSCWPVAWGCRIWWRSF